MSVMSKDSGEREMTNRMALASDGNSLYRRLLQHEADLGELNWHKGLFWENENPGFLQRSICPTVKTS